MLHQQYPYYAYLRTHANAAGTKSTRILLVQRRRKIKLVFIISRELWTQQNFIKLGIELRF